MIAVVADANDTVLASADITGMSWISIHSGFVNQAEIKLAFVHAGKPSHGWIEDDHGVKISLIKLSNKPRPVAMFDIPFFPARSLTIDLYLTAPLLPA